MNHPCIFRLLMSTIITLVFAGGLALAEPSPATVDESEHGGKKAALFFGNAIAGAVIAGPIGMAAGGLAGIWLSERVAQSYELEDMTQQLTAEHYENEHLRAQLAKSDQQNMRLQQMAADSLEFQVLFRTGQDTLDTAGQQRLTRLANFLVRQPSLQVRLSGYADPRGDDAFNEELSRQRVEGIIGLLQSNGVPDNRITSVAYGDRMSVAVEGDYDAYALERRVHIELLSPPDEPSLADVR